MDGTLINSQKEISEENRQAIRDFTERGGCFAVATGRSELITLPFIKDIPVNAPCILYNGAAVYDFSAASFLYRKTIPEDIIRTIIHTAVAVFPSVCIEAFCGGPLKLMNPAGVMDHYITDEKQPYVPGDPREVSDCIKLLLYGAPERLKDIYMTLSAQNSGLFSMTFSAPFYLEILPPDVSKGRALDFIIDCCQLDRSSICAIGDFDNDLEMIKAAGLGAAPSNAQEHVQKAADIIVASNDNHAVRDLIVHHLL